MNISYKINTHINVQQFQNLLKASSLGERRPVDNLECLSGMISNSNLTVSAWNNDKLIGIARSVTDFHYCCYLSDLAVDQKYQNLGIGKKLQALTQKELGPNCTIILLASPAAKDYYGHIGFTEHTRAWTLAPNEEIQ